jgi:hypothetical protein
MKDDSSLSVSALRPGYTQAQSLAKIKRGCTDLDFYIRVGKVYSTPVG